MQITKLWYIRLQSLLDIREMCSTHLFHLPIGSHSLNLYLRLGPRLGMRTDDATRVSVALPLRLWSRYFS